VGNVVEVGDEEEAENKEQTNKVKKCDMCDETVAKS
jgi:hypothetical protein